MFKCGTDYEVLARELFSVKVTKESSTYRELKALHSVYTNTQVASRFGNSIVRHFVDNMAVENIIAVGSKSQKLHQMALEIILSCQKLGIILKIQWKSRTHPWLVHADMGSRCFDASNFSLDFESFSAVLEFFSHLEIQIDCFADFWNKKCAAYFSRFTDVNANGINFFAQSLIQDVIYYAFPPPSLIIPALDHFYKFGASGLFIFPIWKSASFWPYIFPDGRHLSAWVKMFLNFLPSGFLKSNWVTSHTFSNPPRFDIGVLQFDFSGISVAQLTTPVFTPNMCFLKGCDLCV